MLQDFKLKITISKEDLKIAYPNLFMLIQVMPLLKLNRKDGRLKSRDLDHHMINWTINSIKTFLNSTNLEDSMKVLNFKSAIFLDNFKQQKKIEKDTRDCMRARQVLIEIHKDSINLERSKIRWEAQKTDLQTKRDTILLLLNLEWPVPKLDRFNKNHILKLVHLKLEDFLKVKLIDQLNLSL